MDGMAAWYLGLSVSNAGAEDEICITNLFQYLHRVVQRIGVLFRGRSWIIVRVALSHVVLAADGQVVGDLFPRRRGGRDRNLFRWKNESKCNKRK